MDDLPSDVFSVHGGLVAQRAVGLFIFAKREARLSALNSSDLSFRCRCAYLRNTRAGLHLRRHLGCCIADVDLGHGDVELPSVERQGLGETVHGSLGRSVGRRERSWCVCADAAVDNDSTSLWLLLLKVSECLASAEVGRGQVDVDGCLPVGQLLFGQRDVGRRDTGVAEDKVDAAELFGGLLEDAQNNVFLGDIASDVEPGTVASCGLVEKLDSFLKLILATSCDGDVPASASKGDRTRSSKL